MLKMEEKILGKRWLSTLLKSANKKLLKLKMKKVKKSVEEVKRDSYERKIIPRCETVLNASGMKNNF